MLPGLRSVGAAAVAGVDCARALEEISAITAINACIFFIALFLMTGKFYFTSEC
jgi:hypothetical protein